MPVMKPPSPRKVAYCKLHHWEMTYKDLGKHKCRGGRPCQHLIEYWPRKKAAYLRREDLES